MFLLLLLLLPAAAACCLLLPAVAACCLLLSAAAAASACCYLLLTLLTLLLVSQVEAANIGKAPPKPDFLDEEAEQGDGRLKEEGEAQSGESGDEGVSEAIQRPSDVPMLVTSSNADAGAEADAGRDAFCPMHGGKNRTAVV